MHSELKLPGMDGPSGWWPRFLRCFSSGSTQSPGVLSECRAQSASGTFLLSGALRLYPPLGKETWLLLPGHGLC